MIGTVRVVSEREYDQWLEEGTTMDESIPPDQRGERLFNTRACYTCHSIEGKQMVGPPLNGIFGKPVPLEDGSEATVDENYIRESILEPQASIVAGYQPVMPTYQGVLKDSEIDALIAYIKSLE